MDNNAEREFFDDKSAQFSLFKHIKQFVESLGPVKIKTTKSQVSFANKRQFAWAWLPMPWDKRRPKDSLVLSFSLGHKVVQPSIVQAVETYRGRFMHHVIIEKDADINADVKRWLGEAYEFGGG